MKMLRYTVLPLIVLALGACESAQLGVEQGMGSRPQLPPPRPSLMPTINIAPAVGWKADNTPTAAPGLNVSAFATGLNHPRWLLVLPNGDVLVAETNAPPRPDDSKGIRGWVMKKVMARAGAGVPSPDHILLLRDSDGDGVADTRTVFLDNLHSPFGMALVGDALYVANTDALMRFAYSEGATQITAAGRRVAALPAGPLNHHWTKNVIAAPDGSRLYVTVGSNSNVGENGIDQETERAAILAIDPATGTHTVLASGLRNPNGMAWNPQTQALWTVVNERDEIGSDLVPDYLTSVQQGGFYGWPYSYYGQHVDVRVQPTREELVAKAIVPDYALGSHTASLGLAFNTADNWPTTWRDGAFIGQHGSWNRRPASGYKVIFVPFANGQPNGEAVDVLTGFVNAKGEAQGRPVGVVIDAKGGLLVADDVGNVIWRVTPQH